MVCVCTILAQRGPRCRTLLTVGGETADGRGADVVEIKVRGQLDETGLAVLREDAGMGVFVGHRMERWG